MVKKVLSILLWFITAVVVIAVLAVGRHKYRNAPVKNIVINKEYGIQGSFLNDSLVTASLLPLCDTGVSKVKDINIAKIENSLKANPWIASVKAYTDVDRKLNVNIKEHQAVIRIYNNEGNSIYVSAEGFVFPTSNIFTPRVKIASGDFGNLSKLKGKLNDTIQQQKLIDEALSIALALQRNEFMDACIGQIHLNEEKEFELIPNTNNDITIVIGDDENIDDKLLRTSIFLKEKMKTEEFNTYSKVNAKYRNQIVCTKK